jgi:5-methylcytosine-specific restriction endonuclease McrA
MSNWRDMFLPYPGEPLPPLAPSAPPVLRRLYDAAGGHCGICGKPGKIYLMNIDHVVPWAAGGRNVRNRVPAHRPCNLKKADRMPRGCELVWLDVVNTRIAA